MGERERGGECSWLCHAYHAKLRQMQMRSLYSAKGKRESRLGALQAPAVAEVGKGEEGVVATNT